MKKQIEIQCEKTETVREYWDHNNVRRKYTVISYKVPQDVPLWAEPDARAVRGACRTVTGNHWRPRNQQAEDQEGH